MMVFLIIMLFTNIYVINLLVESSSESEDEEEIEETPEYLKYLETLDPKEWKDQDHYKVLGLENLRYKATSHQIKKARMFYRVINFFYL